MSFFSQCHCYDHFDSHTRPCNLLTHLDNHFESRCLLATSSNSRTAIIFNSTSSSKITDMKLLVMGFIFLNGSARLRLDQFVSKSINLFYLCQLISLYNLFFFDPVKQSNRAVIALDQSILKKLINVQLDRAL